MKSGNLYDRVTFDAPTVTADGYGGNVSGWTEQFTTQAHIMFLRGGETVQAARLQGRQPVVVTIRNSTDARNVQPSWRMRDARSGVVYNVRSIVQTENRQFLELTAESGVPA
jgi:SPP1 family predicted phage head-tail adaptor